MSGPLHDFFTQDHRRIDDFLRAAAGAAGAAASYAAFRAALLRHIGMEEQILLPAARRLSGGEPPAIARQLRADHAAIAALLVPTPTPAIVEQLRALLSLHDALEEEAGGPYEARDQLAAAESESLLRRLRAAPPVPLAPHFDGPRAFAAIDRLLCAAGRLR